ncbi:S8 family serine peptidase [Virgibacillus byunsanensis]|uniref:S8 family serine peptidase n=1 Tax=Virgibacillus byunsanensis TaxID=570945 RepID=A0ABW3LKJ5_9BACI
MLKITLTFLLILSVTISIGMGSQANAETDLTEIMDEKLKDELTTATGPLEVIVTFHGDGAPSKENVNLLKTLGIDTGITMDNLPIAGVLATKDQILSLEESKQIRSLFLNVKLEYENASSTAITGVDKVRTDDELRKANGGFPVSGEGVGVVINDSGVDGTHNDLKFGENLIQNVLGATNLNAVSNLLPVTYTEDVPNTDSDSGHGTHVSGTVGGTGVQSAGKYEGVAPGADLVGYGSGAGIAILDTIGGFDYALTHQHSYDIRVITNSWGATADAGTDFNPNDPINVATKRLYDRGIVTVFSAGNSGPGESTISGNYKKAPWVITVAAGTKEGNLADFSSRGVQGKSGTVIMDGEEWTWEDRPTVTAPGVDIISARVPAPLSVLAAEKDAEVIETAYLPYYTTMSGTSMAAPHIAGVVALMLEADPTLSPLDVKEIIQMTATNMPGYQAWEVGAGYVNAYAAIDHILNGTEYGDALKMNYDFNASAELKVEREDVTINYDPLSLNGNSIEFEVKEGLSELLARVNAKGLLEETGNPVNLILIDPEGNEYRSGISALFTLYTDRTVQVLSPIPGTWKMKLEGLGGLALPEEINGELTFKRSGQFSGLDDINGHEAEDAIKSGINNQLLDSYNDSKFKPDQHLTRLDLAKYLAVGNGIRQSSEDPSSDIKDEDAAFIQAVIARGAALKDTNQVFNGVMLEVKDNKFAPNQSVTRKELAYSLVQSLGLQEEAEEHTGEVTVQYGDERITLNDSEEISEQFKGYIQLALDLNILNATFSVSQGSYDIEPTVEAVFEPEETMTRADFAVAITRYYATYLK